MPTPAGRAPAVLCIGGANRDEVVRLRAPLAMGQSNPATTRLTTGGVARNVAENLASLGCRALLLAVVGDDPEGASLLEATRAAGVDVSSSLRRSDLPTGRYIAVIDDDGELVLGLADMAATESLAPAEIVAAAAAFEGIDAVFADANPVPDTLAAIRCECETRGLPMMLDLVSPEKARRLGSEAFAPDMVAGNADEAAAALGHGGSLDALARALVARGAGAAVVHGGAAGLGWADGTETGLLPAPRACVVDVSGAGDALVAGLLGARLRGRTFAEACRAGLDAAASILEVEAHALTPGAGSGSLAE